MKRTTVIAALGGIALLAAGPALADTGQFDESIYAPPTVSQNHVVKDGFQVPMATHQSDSSDWTFDLSAVGDQQMGYRGYDVSFNLGDPRGGFQDWTTTFETGAVFAPNPKENRGGTFDNLAVLDALFSSQQREMLVDLASTQIVISGLTMVPANEQVDGARTDVVAAEDWAEHLVATSTVFGSERGAHDRAATYKLQS